jgi:hypothetical protein
MIVVMVHLVVRAAKSWRICLSRFTLDDPMPGEPPVRLAHKVNTETYFENLTRRMAFLTLVLYIAGYVYVIADEYLLAITFPEWRGLVFRIFWCVYVFALANLLSNTLLGLFYLTH